jgi:hypothetical protein
VKLFYSYVTGYFGREFTTKKLTMVSINVMHPGAPESCLRHNDANYAKSTTKTGLDYAQNTFNSFCENQGLQPKSARGGRQHHSRLGPSFTNAGKEERMKEKYHAAALATHAMILMLTSGIHKFIASMPLVSKANIQV